MAEALAIRETLFHATSLDFTSIWLRSDDQALIKSISMKQEPTELYGVFSDIDSLSSSFLYCLLVFSLDLKTDLQTLLLNSIYFQTLGWDPTRLSSFTLFFSKIQFLKKKMMKVVNIKFSPQYLALFTISILILRWYPEDFKLVKNWWWSFQTSSTHSFFFPLIQAWYQFCCRKLTLSVIVHRFASK